ncbi:Flp family type IVb pilin [uncultured Brevundimonas sp.]|uniref:Flp family type IVb pilin n=1 Tax=uncultured Brevundimonas sp. TaxID=213418 RepID=UPI0030EB48AC
MRRFTSRFHHDDRGAASLEYGLIISLMFLVFLGALTAFGNTTSGLFNGAMNAVRGAMGG